MRGIERFATGVAMLFGVLIIEALAIYGSQYFYRSIELNDTYEMPIEVTVEDAGYSFKTNCIGYVRYMTENDNPTLTNEKALFTFMYIGMVACNVVLTIVMGARTIAMLLFAAQGPLIVASYAFKNDGTAINDYRRWVIIYFTLAMIQVVIAILYKIMLDTLIQS